MSQQIFSSFNMAKNLQFFEKRYFNSAPEDACTLAQRLSGSRFVCKSSFDLCEGVVAPGQLKPIELSAAEILSIQEHYDTVSCLPTNVLCAQRIIHKGRVFHTSSYSGRIKTNDSVLILKGERGVFQLRKCIVFNMCSCDEGSCLCAKECLLILDVFACKAVQMFDDDVGDNLSKQILVVSNTQRTKVCRPDAVDSKCISIINALHEMHVMKLSGVFEN